MPSPSDRPEPIEPTVRRAVDLTTAPDGSNEETRTVQRNPVDLPADAPIIHSTFTFRAAAPPVSASGSGPPSGQAIRDLNEWVELNRAAIDVGDFKLLRSLGTGAFGTVWEAQHFDTGEAVAIKFLSAGDVKWEVMLDEVKFLQALEGTHGIVTVKLVRRATAFQPPYYVMPLANAGSLAEKLKAAKEAAPTARPVLPVPEAVRLFTRVATALAAVHRRGIHHCDLKPRNVLLHRVNPTDDPEPLIADFGQAHLATDDTPALGTFFYMPPDQADAALRKARSDSGWDVYALGAVLYEMLTGEAPRRSQPLVKDLRKTEHLETKLAAYRDGVKAAAPPTAHRKLADPLLVDIIDRCLSLDPARRPRDAGEVVGLLKRRAWWRQVRSLLALGTAGTLLFLLLISSITFLGANRMYTAREENLRTEIDGSLTRTAWYGKSALERTLQEHVSFIEQHAAACPDDVRLALGPAGDRVQKSAYKDRYHAVGDRTPFDAWIADLYLRVARRWPGGEGRTIALVLVAGDAPGGGRPAGGYTLSRSDGTKPPAEDRDPDDPNYRRNWAFRDYFSATGNRYDQEEQNQLVVRHTHVSLTYKSRRDAAWRVDVVTPLWSGPNGTGRIVGLISIGLNVNRHLKNLIDMPDHMLRDDQLIARAVSAFVVNDRERWVWHESGMKGLAEETTPRDPDDLAALAREFGHIRNEDPNDFVPWLRVEEGVVECTDRYTDPVELKVEGTAARKIAHTLTFLPYALSRYGDDPDPRFGKMKDRRWGFVAEVDETVALRPLAELRRDLVRSGSFLVAVLLALAVVLWGWLFRLLRGWEFAGHG